MNLLNAISKQCMVAGIDATIKLSIVLLLASAACWLQRRGSAATRNRIWSLALISGLIIPVGTWFLPQFAIPILPSIQSVRTSEMILPLDTLEELDVSHKTFPLERVRSSESTDVDSVARKDVGEFSTRTSSDSMIMAERTLAWSESLPNGGVVMVWSIGCIYFLMRLFLACWQCRKLVKTAEVATSDLRQVSNAAMSSVGVSFRVATLMSNEVSVPLAVGVIYPAVILPIDSGHWNRDRQRFALLHELVHHERHDVAWQVLAQFVSAIYWFHPLAWYAAHRIRIEREFACDDRVIQIANESADYAQQLVEIARHASHTQLASAVAMAQPSGLEQRVVAIFDSARSHLPLNKASARRWGLGMLVCVIALAVAKPVARAVQLDEKTKQVEKAKAVDDMAGKNAPKLNEPKKRFSEAMDLLKSGEKMQGDVILMELAPSDRTGFAPAHRMRARYFAEQLQHGSNESILKELRWHLENSGKEPDVSIERLWTAYFVKIGKPAEAIPHLELAAKMEPSLLIPLANLYQIIDRKSEWIRILRLAESHFIQILASDPMAREDRLQLVMAQTRLDKPEAAEETMLKGVQLHDDTKIRRSAAEFYVLLFSSASETSPKDLPLQLGYLEKALVQDDSYPDIYEKMIVFFQRAQKSVEAKEVQNILEMMLVNGQSRALVHFALSSVYQIKGDKDQSKRHLFQSFRLDGMSPTVASNLALELANGDQPDLTRANELASNAVQAMPKDPRFRETLATILMLQGKSYDAIAEFEAIIDVAADKQVIHRKLAELYRKIGDVTLAEKHAQKAVELKKTDDEKSKRDAKEAK